MLTLLKDPPWKTQIAQHEREAKTIRIAAATIDQSEILGAQRVVAHHPALIARGSLETEPLRLGEQFSVWHGPTLCHTKMPFSGVFGATGSIEVQLGQSAARYCRVSTADQTCCRQERDLRAFAKKAGYKVVGVWKETASGAKDERVERKEGLALAQARNIDVILVTELTRWGRSMLDLFHMLQDLHTWGVSLVAQKRLLAVRSA